MLVAALHPSLAIAALAAALAAARLIIASGSWSRRFSSAAAAAAHGAAVVAADILVLPNSIITVADRIADVQSVTGVKNLPC